MKQRDYPVIALLHHWSFLAVQGGYECALPMDNSSCVITALLDFATTPTALSRFCSRMTREAFVVAIESPIPANLVLISANLRFPIPVIIRQVFESHKVSKAKPFARFSVIYLITYFDRFISTLDPQSCQNRFRRFILTIVLKAQLRRRKPQNYSKRL
jgi:hypothetical protein